MQITQVNKEKIYDGEFSGETSKTTGIDAIFKNNKFNAKLGGPRFSKGGKWSASFQYLYDKSFNFVLGTILTEMEKFNGYGYNSVFS
jgi:hypothetical protein